MELLSDASTVMQKEMRELVAARSSSPFAIAAISAVVIVLGVVLPLQAGPGWLQAPWLLALWAWLPVFLVASIVADSVAGERERHTLETLLASRISDRAVLLGKMGAAVVYGWGLMLVTIIVSIISINLVYSRDELLLYGPLVLIGGGLLSLLTSVLAASFGVLVSLRASSVRQAQQIVTISLLALLLVQLVGVPVAVRAMPVGWQQSFGNVFDALNSVQTVAILAGLLMILNALLIILAGVWFQRHRLHLD
jgi:ABC-2 type transport system permease protein